MILVFMALVLGRRDVVRSRLLLGSSTAVLLPLTFSIAFGCNGLLGIPFTPISPLAVFVIVGVGVDNLIIMVAFYDQKSSCDASERLSQSMQLAGPAIGLANVTSLIAFFVSSRSGIIAAEAFSVTCGMAIFGMMVPAPTSTSITSTTTSTSTSTTSPLRCTR